MATTFSNGSTSAGIDPNVMKLPEHVDGFIDLEILIDIHKCLSESKFEDDRTLGAWVKANYLQGPINPQKESARPIRNSEGFVNLDKAYRRARTLTGKAQDKWPFLNKDWKKLSSTFIKNAILGDVAMSVVRTEPSGGVRDTPMSNGLNGHRDTSLQTPQSQTSLSANNLSQHQAQEMKSPQPADASLRQQGAERKGHRQDHSPAKANSTIGTPSTDGTGDGTPLRDAGSSKVRGPDGRYVNKDDPTPPEKKRPNIKYVKKSRTRAALEGKSEETAESSDEEAKEPSATSHLVESESGREASQDSSQAAVNVPSAAAATYTILAAEAEAVPSNLDRLPTGFYAHKKRKSESGIQRGGAKRARGSRGGLLGRPPRKSEPFGKSAKLESEEAQNMEVNEPTSQSTPVPDSPASVSARRSSRKSAALALETSTPWDPTGDVLFGSTAQKQSARGETQAPTNGTSRTLDSDKAANPSSINQKAKFAAQAVHGGLSITSKSSTTPVRPGAATSPDKRVSFPAETRTEPGDILYFARVTTAAGDQEVRLLEEDLTHEVGLVKKYAQWLNAGKTAIDFETFKEIFKLSRAG
ncbi:hypothetical protein N0V91_010021 [Didymella pomorum]|uniref:Uncharacterized protein n=1 Tax=Didymella pomorum TaxID=749634 RepID=A0A9W9D3T8_9PLEO|nr:hypothetical protein N0V91_010021 [Didymella pomorum]